MTEETYTLDEAKRLIAVEACREHGHDWDVVEHRTFADPAGIPTAVLCSRCREVHRVELTAVPSEAAVLFDQIAAGYAAGYRLGSEGEEPPDNPFAERAEQERAR